MFYLKIISDGWVGFRDFINNGMIPIIIRNVQNLFSAVMSDD